MKKKTNKKDEGSLTAQEYEEIYSVLREYDRIVNLGRIMEPFYVNDVRVKRLPRIHNIMKKMKQRMEVEYPTSFLA
jgi:hypothetical protein